jgi:hypothetical protein
MALCVGLSNILNYHLLDILSFFYINYLKAVLQIRIHRIHMFLGLLDPDPDPLVRGMDLDLALDPNPDPSIIMQKK